MSPLALLFIQPTFAELITETENRALNIKVSNVFKGELISCYEDYYSHSKFDYKFHFGSSLRFTLSDKSCLQNFSQSLEKESSVSSDL